MSNVIKLTELAAATLWGLGLDLLGLDQGLNSLSTAFMALALLACIFRPFLLCFLAKRIFLRNFGFTPLRDSSLCDWGCLMPFLCHFQDWLCMVWFLDLAISAPTPMALEAPGAGRERAPANILNRKQFQDEGHSYAQHTSFAELTFHLPCGKSCQCFLSQKVPQTTRSTISPEPRDSGSKNI